MKAVWNGITIAESNKTVVVEGNHYFPKDSVKGEYFKASSHTTVCPWKGTASYYTLSDGNGKESKNAAWYYPTPKSAAAEIKDHVAFYSVVNVSE